MLTKNVLHENRNGESVVFKSEYAYVAITLEPLSGSLLALRRPPLSDRRAPYSTPLRYYLIC